MNSEEYQLLHKPPGVEQLADGLTKQLASDRAWRLLEFRSFYKGHVSAVIKKLEHEYDEVEYPATTASTAQATSASTAQATSASAAQATSSSAAHVTTASDASQALNGGTLSRCTQVLIG